MRKSALTISKLLPDLLKESIKPRSANHGLQDFIQADLPIFITWLPGGSAKTRPAGHRRGRLTRTSGEHSWQEVLLSLFDGRRRNRLPRAAVEILLPWSHHPSSRPRPNLFSCILPIGHYLLSNSCYTHIKEDA